MDRKNFRRSFRPGQVRADESADIHEELELYLELRTEELVREGMDPAEARRAAEHRFGDAARIEGELRRQAKRRRLTRGRWMTMGGLRQDLAFALRSLRRDPGFALVSVLTLGLALGGNTAIFSVVDAALLRALPFAGHEELVFVSGYHLTNGEIAIRGASFPEYRDWDERSESVSPMAAVVSIPLALSGDGTAESIGVEWVTADYFEALGVEASRGRTFSAEEHAQVDAFPVATISHELWQSRYAGDLDILGRELILNDRAVTVVGVMPAGFGGVSLGIDVWLPESMLTLAGAAGALEQRGSRFLTVIGRLATDRTAAQRELDVIARELQGEHPEAHEDRFARIDGFRATYLGGTGRLLWVLLGAGTVLLLVGAANVSNLLLVRSHKRTREIVVRRALGAEGHRLVGQLITESLTLAALGGVVGIALAWIGLRFSAR